MEHVNCKICKSKDTVFLSELNDFFSDENSYPLYRCNSCENLFYDPFPEVNYADAYKDILKKYYVEYDAGLLFMTSLLSPLLQERKISSILEIGAGYGFLLDIANTLLTPKSIIGVEPSDNSHNIKQLFNIDYIQDFFDENSACNLPRQDLIIASEVIEHTFDPEQFLLDIKQKLTDQGVGVLTTPNATELFYKVTNDGFESDQNLFPGAHTIIFSKASIQTLMDKHSLYSKVFLSEGERGKTSLIIYFSKSKESLKHLNYLPPTEDSVKEICKKYLENKIKSIKSSNLIYAGYVYRLIEIKMNSGDFYGLDQLFNWVTQIFETKYGFSIVNYDDFDIQKITSVEEYLNSCPAYSSRLIYYYAIYQNINNHKFRAFQAYSFAKKLFCLEKNFSLFLANETLLPIVETELNLIRRELDVSEQRRSSIRDSFVYKVLRKIKRTAIKVLYRSIYFLRRQEIKLKVALDRGSKDLGATIIQMNGSSCSNKRLAIFSHFDKDNIVDDYVIEYVKALHDLEIDIIFVSTAEELKKDELKKISQFCTKVIVKENKGYDFGSWSIGLSFVFKELDRYEDLILCNDSVYAPLFDFGSMFNQMKKFQCWSVTDNYEFEHHMQSYFMCFKPDIFKREFFKKFWSNISAHKHKETIIQRYEVGLSRLLKENNFSVASYCKSAMFSDKPINVTHQFWKELIVQAKCPVIKVELLRNNPLNLDTYLFSRVIKQNSLYDVELIKNHLLRASEPK